MTYKDCVHYEVCIFHHYGDENKRCVHFKNKADFVEVVRCKDGWKGERREVKVNYYTCDHCGKKLDEMKDYIGLALDDIVEEHLDTYLCADCQDELTKLVLEFMRGNEQ